MLRRILNRSPLLKTPSAGFSMHLIKQNDLNPEANKEASKHFNKDFYSQTLDFDNENEQYIEFHQYGIILFIYRTLNAWWPRLEWSMGACLLGNYQPRVLLSLLFCCYSLLHGAGVDHQLPLREGSPFSHVQRRTRSVFNHLIFAVVVILPVRSVA